MLVTGCQPHSHVRAGALGLQLLDGCWGHHLHRHAKCSRQFSRRWTVTVSVVSKQWLLIFNFFHPRTQITLLNLRVPIDRQAL